MSDNSRKSRFDDRSVSTASPCDRQSPEYHQQTEDFTPPSSSNVPDVLHNQRKLQQMSSVEPVERKLTRSSLDSIRKSHKTTTTRNRSFVAFKRPSSVEENISLGSKQESLPSPISIDNMSIKLKQLKEHNDLLTLKCTQLLDTLHSIPKVIHEVDLFKKTSHPTPSEVLEIIAGKIDFIVRIISIKCLSPDMCKILKKSESFNIEDCENGIRDSTLSPSLLMCPKIPFSNVQYIQDH